MSNRSQATTRAVNASLALAASLARTSPAASAAFAAVASADAARENARGQKAKRRAILKEQARKASVATPQAWHHALATLTGSDANDRADDTGVLAIGRGGILRRCRVDVDASGRSYRRPIFAEHRSACDALQSALDSRACSVGALMRENGPRDSSAGASGAMIDAACSVARGSDALWSLDAREPHGTLFVASVTCFDSTENVERLAWLESHLSLDKEKRIECHALTIRESWLDIDGVRRYRVALPSSIGPLWLDRLIGQVADQASSAWSIKRETVKVSLTELWVADGTRKGQTVVVPPRDEIKASRSRGERQPAILASDCVDLLAVCQPNPALDVESSVADIAKSARRIAGARALVKAGMIAELPDNGEIGACRVCKILILSNSRPAHDRKANNRIIENNRLTFIHDAKLACANWLASLARAA